VTLILIVVLPLVVVLGVLIIRMNTAAHYAPQAYYRRKRGGAPVAFSFESLGPRPRRVPPGYTADGRRLDRDPEP
jgi:uncharacterized membrane protein